MAYRFGKLVGLLQAAYTAAKLQQDAASSSHVTTTTDMYDEDNGCSCSDPYFEVDEDEEEHEIPLPEDAMAARRCVKRGVNTGRSGLKTPACVILTAKARAGAWQNTLG